MRRFVWTGSVALTLAVLLAVLSLSQVPGTARAATRDVVRLAVRTTVVGLDPKLESASTVQGGIVAGLLNALVAMDLPGAGTVFMSQTLTYRAPAYVGDTLTARVEVVGLKPAKPVCQLKFSVTNQRGEVILEAEAWTYTLRPEFEHLQSPSSE